MQKVSAGAALLAGGLSLALVLTGCQTGEQPLETVRVSEVTHSVFYAPQYAAINLGFFEDEGLAVELTAGQGADKVMTAVLSGSADIGFSGPEAAIYVYGGGREDHPRVFAQMTRRDGSFLVGREPAEDFDWQKLRGSHLLPGRRGGVPYMTLEHVVRSKGLEPGEDVLFDDSIQFSLMAGAFAGGTGDYAAIFEPTASLMEREGKGHILASIGKESGEIPYTAYFAGQTYLEEHPDTVQRFTNAVYRGLQWVAAHEPAEVAEAIAPSFPDADPELLTTVVERYQRIGTWCTDPVMTEESFDRLQSVMTEAGELEEKVPFEAVVDNSFARAAAEAS